MHSDEPIILCDQCVAKVQVPWLQKEAQCQVNLAASRAGVDDNNVI
jgi:hypothetical protein